MKATGGFTTGIEDYYILKNNKKMRYGYTTGTCAAAAAKGAAALLLLDDIKPFQSIETPKGITLTLPIVSMEKTRDCAICSVKKDAGDDPDVTDGIIIMASVRMTEAKEYVIDGGKGVGRITKKGLEQPIGAAAINSVPRKMIEEAVSEIAELAGYNGGLEIIISAENGKEIAEKTFNSRLGIEGGISILGTSGIVEPMSEAALVKSIETEINQRIAEGDKILLVTLGNYGRAYLDNLEYLPDIEPVKCSNFVGETIDIAIDKGAAGILFVAHIGKFIKVAGGVMNTHSRNADARADIMASCSAKSGADMECVLKILDTVTTDEAISVLKERGLLEKTMNEVIKRISFYLNKRGYNRIPMEAIIFSNQYGYLGETTGAKELAQKMMEGNND